LLLWLGGFNAEGFCEGCRRGRSGGGGGGGLVLAQKETVDGLSCLAAALSGYGDGAGVSCVGLASVAAGVSAVGVGIAVCVHGCLRRHACSVDDVGQIFYGNERIPLAMEGRTTEKSIF
jgi:hypothetical protein